MQRDARNGSRRESGDRDGGEPRRGDRPKAVYALTERGEKTYWTRIGAAFENAKDGSLTIRLHALPVSGVMNVREEKEREGEER